MTSVEWLAEKYNYVTWLRNRDEISSEAADEMRKRYLEQAKQMEKEQTVNAWERGKYIGMSFPQGSIPNEYEQNGTQYYNQTYIEQ
jgi:hypothetical protein